MCCDTTELLMLISSLQADFSIVVGCLVSTKPSISRSILIRFSSGFFRWEGLNVLYISYYYFSPLFYNIKGVLQKLMAHFAISRLILNKMSCIFVYYVIYSQRRCLVFIYIFFDICEALGAFSHAQTMCMHLYLCQFLTISRRVFFNGPVPTSYLICIISASRSSACMRQWHVFSTNKACMLISLSIIIRFSSGLF